MNDHNQPLTQLKAALDANPARMADQPARRSSRYDPRVFPHWTPRSPWPFVFVTPPVLRRDFSDWALRVRLDAILAALHRTIDMHDDAIRRDYALNRAEIRQLAKELLVEIERRHREAGRNIFTASPANREEYEYHLSTSQFAVRTSSIPG